MKTNMKLIDKVKPKVLRSLEDGCKFQYSSSYRSIIASLKSVNKYRDLSINQVDNIITFLPKELHPNGKVDFYWGDYLLQKKYQV